MSKVSELREHVRRLFALCAVSAAVVAPIPLAALLVWGNSSYAAPPDPGSKPDPECDDISGRLTANPTSIDPIVSLKTTLTWSVEVPKDCRAKPIVTLQGLPVELSGQKTYEIDKTTTFFLRLKKEDRDLARAIVTVLGDPGIITVSPGGQVTADDIAKFNAQWMAPYPRQKMINFAQSTLSQFDLDGVWGTGEGMAAMVRMFDLTHDTRYLDHLRELIQIALKYRDDLPLDKDRPDLIRPTDEIRNKVGLPGWGGRAVDSGGLHRVDEVTSSLYAYPIAAFARIVAENPSLQTLYSCDGSSDKHCKDAIDYANLVLETVNFFLPQIHRQRGAGNSIEATLTSPEEYRNRPTAADCEKAYDDAEKADPGNHARWDQQWCDCTRRNELAGRGLPHNQDLTFSMVLIELTRVLNSPFYLQSPKRVGGAENMRDFLLLLISRQQRYFANRLFLCEDGVCWRYMDNIPFGTHPEDTDHGSMDMSYVGLVFRDFDRLSAAAERFHEPLAFTSKDLHAFANTFVGRIAKGDNFRHDVAGQAPKPPYTDNSRCEGWLELTRADPRVWQACRDMSLRIIDSRQPYLNTGNHSMLLMSKKFLPLQAGSGDAAADYSVQSPPSDTMDDAAIGEAPQHRKCGR
jgi:hypothetical protein